MNALHRESWRKGARAWFEYHCLESHQSGDAQAWYRSHQQVTVLGSDPKDWESGMARGLTFDERAEEGLIKVYRVRFDDGLEWAVFEDELLTAPRWSRPNPPPCPVPGGHSRLRPTHHTHPARPYSHPIERRHKRR